ARGEARGVADVRTCLRGQMTTPACPGLAALLVRREKKYAALTLEEAAEKFTHIAAWEAGEALPSYPQLERLAEAAKHPADEEAQARTCKMCRSCWWSAASHRTATRLGAGDRGA